MASAWPGVVGCRRESSAMCPPVMSVSTEYSASAG
jgi:hypothetical protein